MDERIEHHTPKPDTKWKNYSSETKPSLSVSALLIISCKSYSEISRVSYLTARLRLFMLMNPDF